jgi:hypothetical protein
MIGFFTDPHPDELLYSACARFGDKSKNRSVATVAQELFGSRTGMAVVLFPNRLGHLVSVMPPGHKYTVDRLIDDHTPLRFYSPFTEAGRVRIIRSEMQGKLENRICSRLGINAGRLASPDVLRFCPECVKSDRDNYKETYWHRVHQLSGVHVCPDHSVFLKESLAGCRERESFTTFISAEGIVDAPPTTPIDPQDREHNLLLKIAQDAKWLLNWRGTPPTNEERRLRYHNLLLIKGLAYYKGRFRHTELIKQFHDFFPANLLKILQSEIGNQKQPWPLRILRQNRVVEIQPPLRHLLLLTFLGCSAEQFFTTFEEYTPFGNAPWPCLNRASDHFEQETVSDCHITNGHKKTKGRPVGLFSCDCGFKYLRLGPDTESSNRVRFDKVIAYGSVWEKYFGQRWNDPSITLTNLAKELDVIPFTLRRHAIRLKLPFPRQGRWARPTSQKIIKKYSNTRQTFEECMKARRQQWLSIRKQNPKATRQQLIRLASYTYYWLSRHSIEWLTKHLPPAQTNNPEPVRVDWKTWDLTLSREVKKVAKQIKKSHAKPVRVSKEEIINQIGHRSWIEQSLSKLPKTAQALNVCLESREDFLIRRVNITQSYFQSLGRCPTYHQIDVRAGTRTKNGQNPRVRKALESALENLQAQFGDA